MPQYLAPGVYVEEVPGARPIEGVGTATGAFVGIAERGPIGQAVLVTNPTQYTETFGGYIANGYLPYAVNQFFAEGGTRAYVVRTCRYTDITNPNTATAVAADLTLRDRATSPRSTLKLTATSRGSWGDHVAVIVEDGRKDPTNKFRMTVLYKGQAVEFHEELRVETVAAINGVSTYIRAADVNPTLTGPDRRPVLSARKFGDLEVTALAKGLTAEITVTAGSPPTFKLVIAQGGAVAETFPNLTMADVARKVNGVSKLIVVNDKSAGTPTATTAPEPLPFYSLAGGWDGLAGVALKDRATTPLDTLQVSAWTPKITVDVVPAPADANKFKLVVKQDGSVVEEFDELTMATVEQEVNERSAFIEVNDLRSASAAPLNRPAEQTGAIVPAGLEDGDFIGSEAGKNGLHALDAWDDVNIVAIPDRPGDREVIIQGYSYCQNRKDCFFVAEAPLGLNAQQTLAFKQGTGDFAGNAFNTSYAALYYPWILISDPLTGKNRLMPPSGAVAGTYSYTDVARGVHKAPAGINEGYLNTAMGIERSVTKGEQELLNPEGINVIRAFAAAGVVVWGARTLSADPEWKYVNVRRLLLFIEESIENGLQWVVFEPNDRGLWGRVRRDVTAFLSVVWQSGALFGATAEEAFFVKVDDENNPPETRALGRLVIDIGVAPVKPAEFVIVRIALEVRAAG